MSSKKTPLPSKKAVSQEKYRSFTEKKSALKEAEIAEALEEIKITTVHATTNSRCWDGGSKSIRLPRLPSWRKSWQSESLLQNGTCLFINKREVIMLLCSALAKCNLDVAH